MNVSAIIVTRGGKDLTPIWESLPKEWERVCWDNSGFVTAWLPHGLSEQTGYVIAHEKVTDLAVYGRYAAIEFASHDLIYVQDDDCVVSDPQAIVDALWEAPCQACDGVGRAAPGSEIWKKGAVACPACLTWGTAYAAGEVVCNMPPEFRHDGYTDSALVGFGAAFHRDTPERVFERAVLPEEPGDSGGPTVLRNLVSPSFNRTCDIVFTALTPRVLVDVPKTNLPWAEDEGRMYRQPRHVEERTRMLELARLVRDA